MKVIFLDFDGVLNSSASFIRVARERRKLRESGVDPSEMGAANEILDPTCCSNFQYILEKCPEAKIVVSSTWRNCFELDWLREHLTKYGIEGSRIIDKTGISYRGFTSDRGLEISEWLDAHKEVTHFVIIDDNHIGNGHEADGKVVDTSWLIGLTLEGALKALDILGADGSGRDFPL